MKTAEELYVKICQLPIDEQVRFFEWAREFIKETERQIEGLKKKKEKENADTISVSGMV